MPTLERAYKEAEAIALEAAALGRLDPEHSQYNQIRSAAEPD
jgi:hypothetical protein